MHCFVVGWYAGAHAKVLRWQFPHVRATPLGPKSDGCEFVWLTPKATYHGFGNSESCSQVTDICFSPQARCCGFQSTD